MKKFKLVVTLDIEDFDSQSACDTLFMLSDDLDHFSGVDNWQIIDVQELIEEEI